MSTLDQAIKETEVAERVANPKLAVEHAWIRRSREQGLKASSMAYKRAEVEFFAGAMAAIHATDPNATDDKLSSKVPPVWILNAMAGRPIVGK